jgi:hypothetical protein
VVFHTAWVDAVLRELDGPENLRSPLSVYCGRLSGSVKVLKFLLCDVDEALVGHEEQKTTLLIADNVGRGSQKTRLQIVGKLWMVRTLCAFECARLQFPPLHLTQPPSEASKGALRTMLGFEANTSESDVLAAMQAELTEHFVRGVLP